MIQNTIIGCATFFALAQGENLTNLANMVEISDPYFSPESPGSFLRRSLPTSSFYLQTALTVFRGAFKARSGRYSDDLWQNDSLSLLRALERTGIAFEVLNHSVLKRIEQPSVIIGNHMSTAETFLMAGFCLPFAPLTYVVKRSLVDYPVFGHIMRSRNPVVVGRENPREDFKTVMDEGLDRLRKGYHLVIFPQKTRSVDFLPSEFNSIGVKLARHAGAPIIPLALQTDAWGNGSILKDFGRIRPDRPMRFEFGEPIFVNGPGKMENQAVIEFIASRLQKWSVKSV